MNGLVWLHVAAGSAALIAGAGALAFRKGSPLHGEAGTVFFATMLAMAGTGAVMAALKPERGTAVVGLLTCYLVATAWLAARNRAGVAGAAERAGLAVALACALLQLSFGAMAAAAPDGRLDSLPAGVHYPFAALALIAAALDLNFILRGTLSRRQRIARHLWRMCAALFIASASFFLGQQDEFPDALRGLFLWYLPPLGALAAMLFWLVRVRFAGAWQHGPAQRPLAAGRPARL